MDKYNNYHIDFFLADDGFVEWVHSGKPIEGTRWEALLHSDPNIRPEFEQARALVMEWKGLPSQLSDQKLSHGIQRIMTSVNERDEVRVPLHDAYRIWFKIAAILILMIGLGWTVMRQFNDKNAYTYEKLTQRTESELVEILNDLNGDHEITLPDGSKIMLSKGSRVSYSKHLLTDSTRNVFLKGDGFFSVVKDEKHPFLVYTDGLVTRVVGTSFKIASIGSEVSVAVRSGKVAVYRMREFENNRKDDILLTPNQQAVFTTEQNQISRKLVEDPLVLRGQEQILNFDYVESPVSKIFESLEKAYGIKIIYDAETFSSCNITIPLREEPFFTKLDIICKTIQAKYNVSGNDVIISGKGCN
ncbi:FecR family protein [Dyadobacter pollutisoli]|uniref:FecR family protein n=1 Tax=Dyadobacter pollutisoli TaxID=2910158 RepID=A0A9E8NHB3_9BACT|nr:FecR family protein [Dyadobacter pollutisoli]WAC15007.1 FecR family protein [Dyadobacter pollutisoli]